MQSTTQQTVVVSRRVRKGCEQKFEQLSSDMTKAATDFVGHLGATMFRPNSALDPEYRIVFKFEDRESLNSWLSSKIRADYLSQIEELLLEPSKIERMSGLETWFTLPSRVAVRPSKFKMAIVSWLGLFPIVAIIFWLFGPWLARLSLLPRVALVTAVVMVLMTWVAMPQLTKIFSFWLYPKSNRGIR